MIKAKLEVKVPFHKFKIIGDYYELHEIHNKIYQDNPPTYLEITPLHYPTLITVQTDTIRWASLTLV